MNNIYSYISVLTIFAFLSSCIIVDDDGVHPCIRGEGPLIEQQIHMPPLRGIEAYGSIDVVLVNDDHQLTFIHGPASLIDLVNLEVINGTWVIDTRNCYSRGELTIVASIPNLEYVAALGSGDIFSEDVLFTGDVDIVSNGSGDIDLALEADDIAVQIEGSGDVILFGDADELLADIRGSGDLGTFDMTYNDVDILIKGSGDARVSVRDELLVTIRGSGDVFYKGDPVIALDDQGSGDLIDAN